MTGPARVTLPGHLAARLVTEIRKLRVSAASPVPAEQSSAPPAASWGDLAADVMGLVDRTLDSEAPVPTEQPPTCAHRQLCSYPNCRHVDSRVWPAGEQPEEAMSGRSEPTYDELRAELEHLRKAHTKERDFDVAGYLLEKIAEAVRCRGVVVLGQKGAPDQRHPGAWVSLPELPTLATPQAPCSSSANHGAHYWRLVRQTTAPDGPVTLCPGVYGVMLARSVPTGQEAEHG